VSATAFVIHPVNVFSLNSSGISPFSKPDAVTDVTLPYLSTSIPLTILLLTEMASVLISDNDN
jgi:hypothetical protein